jgi:hypothetical protein
MAQFTPLARTMAYQLRRTCPPGTRIASVRQRTKSVNSATAIAVSNFHTSLRVQAYKDDQDKDSLKPGSSEYSKSGTGDDEAAHSDAAFDPNQTGPKEQEKNVEQENGGSVSIKLISFPC